MNPKELSEFTLASEAVGDSDRLFVNRACRGIDLDVVQFKEQQCSNDSRSLIAVDKWMILHDVE